MLLAENQEIEKEIGTAFYSFIHGLFCWLLIEAGRGHTRSTQGPLSLLAKEDKPRTSRNGAWMQFMPCQDGDPMPER